MNDRPHIKWSNYWNGWTCTLGMLTRLGESPALAYGAWHRAKLAGNKR